jgi:hypothetical protein
MKYKVDIGCEANGWDEFGEGEHVLRFHGHLCTCVAGRAGWLYTLESWFRNREALFLLHSYSCIILDYP